jgi:hypothetical protein
VDQSDRRVVIESPVAPTLGVRVRRTIEVVPDSPRVRIVNVIERVEANVFPVHIWTVTQVHSPPLTLLDVAADRVDRSRVWVPFGEVRHHEPFVEVIGEDVAIAYLPRPDRGRKVGTLGRWVAGVYDSGDAFLQATHYIPRGAYPDASSAQVYSDGNYTELELLSEFVHLQPGETLENRVLWELVPVDPSAPLEQLHQILSARASEWLR